jgi:hypothetical protein
MPLFAARSFYDAEIVQCCGFWHRFDADPDPTFHFDDDPNLDPDLSQVLLMVENRNFLKTFIHSSTSLHCFTFIYPYPQHLLYSFNIRKANRLCTYPMRLTLLY